MRIVIQRVKQAQVRVDGNVTGAIAGGLLVFLGIARDDTERDAAYLIDKLLGLRIFSDENGKMNRDLSDAGGALLIVSQFTLYADCRKGRRPGFDLAAPPVRAQQLYNYFVEALRRTPFHVQTGVFQAAMEVELVNDGPVTIIVDSMTPTGHD
jgi:D-tyrosyl-tRNA(Tyr) deacylase